MGDPIVDHTKTSKTRPSAMHTMTERRESLRHVVARQMVLRLDAVDLAVELILEDHGIQPFVVILAVRRCSVVGAEIVRARSHGIGPETHADHRDPRLSLRRHVYEDENDIDGEPTECKHRLGQIDVAEAEHRREDAEDRGGDGEDELDAVFLRRVLVIDISERHQGDPDQKSIGNQFKQHMPTLP